MRRPPVRSSIVTTFCDTVTAVGHCYEFGVAVDASCGHAMIVAPEGGACVCSTCNAHCEGRFPACAGIIARPGYVPAVAPGWAVGQMDLVAAEADDLASPPPFPVLVSVGDGGLIGAPVEEVESEATLVEVVRGELTAAREEMQATLDRVVGEMRDEMHVTLEGVALERARREHEERDRDLAGVLERVALAFGALTERLEADRAERAGLVDMVGRLAELLSAAEPGAAARARPQTVVGGTVDPRLVAVSDEIDAPVAASHVLAPRCEPAEIDLTEVEREIDELASDVRSPVHRDAPDPARSAGIA